MATIPRTTVTIDAPVTEREVAFYEAGLTEGIEVGRQQVDDEHAALWAKVRETVQRVATQPSQHELQDARRAGGSARLPHPDVVARTWGEPSMDALQAAGAAAARDAAAFFRPRRRTTTRRAA